MNRLVILNGPDKGRRCMVPPRELTLGRAEDNRIVLKGDEGVAPQHAVIETAAGGVAVRAVGAEVKVNGMPVGDATVLKDRDVITLGDTRLEYQVVRQRGGDTRRRKGSMYRLAIIGVVIVVAVEIAFVVLSSMMKGDEDLLVEDPGEEAVPEEVQPPEEGPQAWEPVEPQEPVPPMEAAPTNLPSVTEAPGEEEPLKLPPPEEGEKKPEEIMPRIARVEGKPKIKLTRVEDERIPSDTGDIVLLRIYTAPAEADYEPQSSEVSMQVSFFRFNPDGTRFRERQHVPAYGQNLARSVDLLGETYWSASLINHDASSVSNYAGYVVNLEYKGKYQDQIKALKSAR